MYHVMRVTDADHRTKAYREELKSSSEKEVESKLAELIPRYGAYNINVFTEVEFDYTGIAKLKL